MNRKRIENIKIIPDSRILIELLDVSILTPSGGSFRTTVPVSIPRDVWGKEKEHLPVCFVKEGDRILLIPFDDFISGDYPESLKKKALDECTRKILGRLYTGMKESMERLARGEISSAQFWDELERKCKTTMERLRPYVGKISGSLAFADELESSILSATLAEDELRGAEISGALRNSLGDGCRKKQAHSLLDALRSRDDIEDDVREFVESRLMFELKRVNEELEKIRSIICEG